VLLEYLEKGGLLRLPTGIGVPAWAPRDDFWTHLELR